MRKKLQILFCVSLFALQCNIAFASHIVGGELSYKYLGNSQYEITLKVYRDCYNGLAAYDNPTNVFVFDVNGNLAYTLPITFPGSDTLDNSAGNPCLIVPPNICVEEAVFVYTVTLPDNPGGYSLLYQRCCRNLLIQNIVDPSNTGGTYVATIPDPSIVTGNSSPYYKNFPPTVMCVNLPFVFDHSAIDPDGDSLVYSLCAPYVGADAFNPYPNPPQPPPYANVTYVSPYTALDPMGGSPPMAINSSTGLLTVTPNTIGNFVVGVCVTEYRNGDSISSHKRDFQFNVAECTPSVIADIPAIINNCSAYEVCFENNSIGGTTYHWNFGTGNPGDTSNLAKPCFTYSDTGVYTVTIYINPGTFCGDTTTALVYIYPTLIAAMNAPDGCEGIPVNFTDLSTSEFGTIDSWDWNFGDGGTSGQQNPSYIFNSPGTYTVTLIVMNDLGCVDTVKETVLINPSPTTIVTPNDTTICYLDVVDLFATGTGTFSWSPNYNLSNSNVNNPVAGPDVTTTYVVTVTNTFGCYAKDSITITVFDTIIANAGPDEIICPGTSVQLNASGGINYSWSPGSGLTNPNISNPVAHPTSTTTYVLTVSAGSCIGTDAITIFVKPYPNIAAGPDVTICEGDSVEISASGGTSYSWTPTNTLTDPSIANPIAFPGSTTTYTVSATDSNSCDTTIVDDLTVFVLSKPTIVVTNDTSIILGTFIDLLATGGASCHWEPSTGLSDPNSCNPIATPTVPTTYYVYITTPEGCVYVDSVVIGIRYDPVVKFPTAFSPNNDGTNDYFRPVILGLATIDAFRIYNRWGQVVFEITGVSVASGTLPANWGWDGTFNGKEQELAVYIYSLVGSGTATGTPIELKGNFTRVR